jgi:hypothetical protein
MKHSAPLHCRQFVTTLSHQRELVFVERISFSFKQERDQEKKKK